MLAAGDGDSRETILAGYAEHARDTTFATQLLYRLRDGSQNAGHALVWLESELEKSGTDAEEIIIGEHRTLSRGNVTTGNIIRGLRKINDIEWTEWFEAISRVDALLRERTDFAALDFPSRDQYRQAIEELARRSEAQRILRRRPSACSSRRKRMRRRWRTRPAAKTSASGWSATAARASSKQAIGYRPTFGTRLPPLLPEDRLGRHRRAGRACSPRCSCG